MASRGKSEILWEGERYDPIGDADAREALLAKVPGLFTLKKESITFQHAGVFQLGASRLLVLPWILRSVPASRVPAGQSRALDLILFVKEGFEILGNNEANADRESDSGDFVFLSILLRIRRLLGQSLHFNIFHDASADLNVIRGRWKLERDLLRGPRPLSFHCHFDDCDQNHPLLIAAKWCVHEISRRTSSRACKAIETDLWRMLEPITTVHFPNIQLFDSAEALALRDKRFQDWLRLLSLARHFLTSSNGGWAQLDGSAFVFPSARMWEELVEGMLREIGLKVEEQVRLKLLGGSLWVHEASGFQDRPEDEEANEIIGMESGLHSRPDFLASTGSSSFFVECKYKHLEIRRKHGVNYVSNFNHNDRNQLISFILSTSLGIVEEHGKVFVLFPLTNPTSDTHRNATLSFHHAELKASSRAMSLKWGQFEEGTLLIEFLGIDVGHLWSDIRSERQTETQHLAECLGADERKRVQAA